MGIIKTKGTAKRSVPYDIMEMTVSFFSKSRNVSEVIGSSVDECDKFIAILTEGGTDINSIKFSRDAVDEAYMGDEQGVYMRREIKLRFPFNMEYLNYITDTVRENNFHAHIETEYFISDVTEKIHKELIKEALDDARAKAEVIACAAGCRIVGIESVCAGSERYDNEPMLFCESRCVTAENSRISSKLPADEFIIRETVDAEWKTEQTE